MWPTAARRMIVPIPSRSHSGPPKRMDRPKPQNAAPSNPPDLHVREAQFLLDLTHDVAADGKRHRRGDQGDTTGDEETTLVHGDARAPCG